MAIGFRFLLLRLAARSFVDGNANSRDANAPRGYGCGGCIGVHHEAANHAPMKPETDGKVNSCKVRPTRVPAYSPSEGTADVSSGCSWAKTTK